MKDNFLKGFFKENPLFAMLLGCCPALAITTSLENALGMTLAFTFVVVLSNLFISLLNINEKIKELIQPVRIAVYIAIIATLVTVVEMIMKAFLPALYNSLGVFISLITVNCIVLGRAEAYASKNKPLDSIVDGISMGLGYGMALVIISVVREVLGQYCHRGEDQECEEIVVVVCVLPEVHESVPEPRESIPNDTHQSTSLI